VRRAISSGVVAVVLLPFLTSCTSSSHAAAGVLRTYFIAADEIVWDYAPLGTNAITGAAFDETAGVFVAHGPGRIGTRYKKCVYRGYTDASFATHVPATAEPAYLGILGPVIHAAVGDRVHVVFKNNCAFAASLHMHGLRYDKANEGAPYMDGTRGAAKADDNVAPGSTYTYNYTVPERAGPGPMDPSSVLWMYHSHVDEVADVYAGLMGPVVVTGRGMARADGSPKNVDREMFDLFEVVNENASPYLDANIKEFAGRGGDTDGDEFTESNLKHSINGFVYGNQPDVTLQPGKRTRWYLMGMGTEVDLHTPHWHGNTVVVNGMRTDVVSLLPATMAVADMVPDADGTWLFHCHVNDHITAGMQTRYTVS
jgi:FtsP/CotA-like multicopper oxidase with cupredoxin domain